METAILKHAEANVPRYTSYPTAPHFHEGVGPAQYRKWLGELTRETSLSLYLHVPFCRDICWYCGCTTKGTHKDGPLKLYAGQLLDEIDLVAGAMNDPGPVRHLHWGGGTPTLLPPDCFRDIMARLRSHFTFAEGAELAVEIDPRTLTKAMVEAMADTGINRVSLGVQDLTPAVQAAIGRKQPFEVVERAVTMLREGGIDRINLDLMYGLPAQTEQTAIESAELAASLDPDRLALFGYAHVPWMKANQKLIDETTLPDAVARFVQAEAAAGALEKAGFVRIGLDHFARPEDSMAKAQSERRMTRNFQGYTDDAAGALIGLGCSSVGSLPQGYVQNAVDTGAWSRAIADGCFAIVKGFALDDDDRLRRTAIERIMCDMVLDTGALAEAHGMPADTLDDAFPRLEPLQADGLVSVEGRTITVPIEARPALRLVAAAFDAYLGRGAARHSRAV